MKNNSFRLQNMVGLQWLEHIWNHENLRQGQFELMSVSHSARSGSIIWISFDFLKHEDMLCSH